jgi:hypothetical protein
MASWAYCFAVRAGFPEPVEEIQTLADVAQRGLPAYLMLAERPDPPMARAQAGDSVLLCTRSAKQLWCHGEAAIAVVPRALHATPSQVLDLYGPTHDRWFAELRDVRLFDRRVLSELTSEEHDAFVSGQAYVKRLS